MAQSPGALCERRAFLLVVARWTGTQTEAEHSAYTLGSFRSFICRRLFCLPCCPDSWNYNAQNSQTATICHTSSPWCDKGPIACFTKYQSPWHEHSVLWHPDKHTHTQLTIPKIAGVWPIICTTPKMKRNRIPFLILLPSTLGLQGWVDHHTWFIQGWGSSPGHAACQSLNQPRCSPSPNLRVLYRVSLHNPGQPKTCYVDMMAGRELTNTWLLLPLVIPSAYWFCINLFAFFIVCNAAVSVWTIIYMICREYYDLYVLLCGNPSQTEVTSVIQKYIFKT